MKVHRDEIPAAMMKELRKVIGLPLHLSTNHVAVKSLFLSSSDVLKADVEVEDIDDDGDGEDEILYSDTYVTLCRPCPFFLTLIRRIRYSYSFIIDSFLP